MERFRRLHGPGAAGPAAPATAPPPPARDDGDEDERYINALLGLDGAADPDSGDGAADGDGAGGDAATAAVHAFLRAQQPPAGAGPPPPHGAPLGLYGGGPGDGGGGAAAYDGGEDDDGADDFLPAELSDDEAVYEQLGVAQLGRDDADVCFGCDFVGAEFGGVKSSRLERFAAKLSADAASNFRPRYYRQLADEYETLIRAPANRHLAPGAAPLPPFTADQIYRHMHAHLRPSGARRTDTLIHLYGAIINTARHNDLVVQHRRKRRRDGRPVKAISLEAFRVVNDATKMLRLLERDAAAHAGAPPAPPLRAPPPRYTLSRLAAAQQQQQQQQAPAARRPRTD